MMNVFMCACPVAMFRIKVCGVTRVEDARAATGAGADAIGLNFYPLSKRRVPTDQVAAVSEAIGPGVSRVGVFVNASHDEIADATRVARLNAVQLHGDETPAFAAEIDASVRLIRAHRCDQAGLWPLAEWLRECERLGRRVDAVLVDAPGQDGVYGGTGERADWGLVARERELLGETPLVLAGGLTPENIAAAIDAVRPAGVDTASGVERDPGVKSLELMLSFAKAALSAFSALEQ